MKTNLAIESIGIVTSLGNGVKETLLGLKIKPKIQSFILDENHLLPVSRVNLAEPSSNEERAFLLADLAIKSLSLKDRDLSKTAILIGCTKGESQKISNVLKKKTLDHQTYLEVSANLINKKISEKYKLPFFPISSAACATGAQAIQKAAMILNENKFDQLILCMTEASLTKEMIAAFYQLGVLTKEPCGTAPFEKKNHGFHMGEGAIALLLSKTKKNKSYGKIIGASTATDGEHFTTFPKGPAIIWQTVQSLCESCNVSVKNIGHVNLHGTGTSANDQMELELTKLFIKENNSISFSAFKPYTGHLLGASGLSELALSLICMQNKWLPPILNCNTSENLLTSHFIFEPKGRSKEFNYFINLSYGLGSTIGVILGGE